MATDGRTSLSARVDEEVRRRVEEYQDAQDYEDRSEAVRDVLDAGLREVNGPVSAHARDMALDAAYHLTLVAVTVIVIGFATTLTSAAHGTAVALVLMTVALAPVAAIEVARTAGGQSELSEVVRR